MNPALRPTQPIVWINGWPAVGKQAVAQCLYQFLGHDRAIIIDDREFTDTMKLSPEAQMARYASRANSGRARGLSMGDQNRHSHSAGTDGNYSGKGSYPFATCTEKDCASKDQCSSNECPSKECPSKTSVVRECIAGRLIADHDEISLAAQARQEACFRKYIHDIHEEPDPNIKSTIPANPKATEQNKKLPTNMQKVIIFTDCRANNAAGAEGAWRYADAAKQANRLFIPIYVECMPEEHERRAQTSDRVYTQPDGAPITGVEAARELQALSNGRLYTFPQETIPGLFVNVTTRGTHDSVMDIISFINAVMEKRNSAVMESVAEAVRRRPGSSIDATAE
ncbi:hypothetical protein SEUCBS140593_010550 [Sporothrix eucalyptigena]|uniref:Uncharacterized protein n=1 Tax=Sporothrix eucalyptigena TaxID=1812306 RepID=A0ABP0D1N0_9PEZI